MTQNVLDTLEQLMTQAKAEKQASLKKSATDPSEPTTHPVMDVPDGTQPAKEGERSKENLADVKKNVGGNGNTGQRDSSAGSKTNPVDSIGTVKMESDEVKGNVSDPKSTKDKPDESPSHQSNSTFNEKYSSLQTLGRSIVDGFTALLGKEAAGFDPVAKGEQVVNKAKNGVKGAIGGATSGLGGLAGAAVGLDKKVGLVTKEAEFTKEAEEKLAAANEYPEDAQAGYVMAEYLLNTLVQNQETQEKVAADTAVAVEHITKTAQDDADLLVNYLVGRQQGRTKAAQFRKTAGEGGPAMAGAEDGAEVAPPEGGMPPGAEGGMPEGGGGEAPHDEEHVLDALAQALDEAGISPEELAQALEKEHGGGGEGGMPPGAEGGMPPGAMPEGAGMPEDAGAPPGGEVPKMAALRYAAKAVKAAAAGRRQTKIAAALRSLRK